MPIFLKRVVMYLVSNEFHIALSTAFLELGEGMYPSRGPGKIPLHHYEMLNNEHPKSKNLLSH